MPKSCKCILDRMVFKGAMTEEERDKIMRNLKGTVWHPYPKEKPEEDKKYLVTRVVHRNDGLHTYVEIAEYFDMSYYWLAGVVAWAELPEPFEEGEEKDESSEIQGNT